MEIEITTDRNPWVNDKKTKKGDIVKVEKSDGEVMIALGFAVEVKPKKKAKAKKNAK